MALRPLPEGLHPTSPSILIATILGAGRLQPASGTWGSLAALAFGILWLSVAPPETLLLGAAIAYILGVWASADWLKHEGLTPATTQTPKDAGQTSQSQTSEASASDPQAIVIDELVGLWMALSVAPANLWGYLAAFALFRFFDIVKVWPANWVDKNVKGPHGIMADDVVAGLWAMAALMIIQEFIK